MGIDPNSHKPHQSFPRPHVSSADHQGASTSESINNNKVPFFNSRGSAATDHHKISFTKEETSIISSPPLNLDLTISLPSPVEENKNSDHESAKTCDVDIDLNC